MVRTGRKGRLWLRAFHIFFMALYTGGVISELLIIAFTGSAQSDGALQAMYRIPGTLTIINAPGMSGTIITGLLLAWLTPWGFFKHKWVIYTLSVGILVTLIFFTFNLPLLNKVADLVGTEGLSALQNPEYINAWNRLIIIETVKTLLFISAVFISVFKPWEKREGAKATS